MLIKASGSVAARDPHITYHNGFYYHCHSYDEEIYITKSVTIDGIKDAPWVKVWSPDADKPWSKQLWAPEMHVINGKCYIYVACDDGDNRNHRMYVLYNDSNDPQAPYKMGGKIADTAETWAIDGTIIHWQGKMYMVWSGWEADKNNGQHLYIAQMDTPFSFCSPRVRISSAMLAWEKHGSECKGVRRPPINEGPCALYRGDKLYIVYSASGSWCNDYCLGLLELVGEDIMAPAHWTKHPVPVFSKTEEVKGPGHCSIVTDSPDGDWLFYHAFDEDEQYGWNSCSAYGQKFTWDGDFPVFGKPEK